MGLVSIKSKTLLPLTFTPMVMFTVIRKAGLVRVVKEGETITVEGTNSGGINYFQTWPSG